MIQSKDEHANVAFLDGAMTIWETIQCVDANNWEQALQEEYKSLMATRTCKLTPMPNNRNHIGCKWVFCAKTDANGHVVHYKARLVAKDFAQVHGIDFHEAFAPMA